MARQVWKGNETILMMYYSFKKKAIRVTKRLCSTVTDLNIAYQ